MRRINAIASELIGLFIDDGSLVVGILAWAAAVWLGTATLPALTPWGAPGLAIGLALILLENCVRRAGRK
jgi:hypothetical protein